MFDKVTIFGVGAIAGNAWAGFVYDRVGSQALFRICSGFLVAVGLAAWMILREGPRAGMELPTSAGGRG